MQVSSQDSDNIDLIRAAPEPLRKRFSVAAADQDSKKKVRKQVRAEILNRRGDFEPLWVGEKFVYDITFIGTPAGALTLETLPFKTVGKRRVYHLRAHALSSKWVSWFYKIDDKLESFLDYEGLFSHRLQVSVNESKRKHESLELNDFDRRQTHYFGRTQKLGEAATEKQEKGAIPRYVQDSLSAFYFVRTRDLKAGERYEVPIASEGKTKKALIEVIRHGELDTKLGRLPSIMLKVSTPQAGETMPEYYSHIWLSNDQRRVPLLLEAQMKIGQVKAVIRELKPGTAPLAPGA